VKRLSTQASLQRSVTSALPVQSLALKEATTTPLLNAVRTFRTSSVRLSAEKAHDHSKLWVIERVVSAALVPLIPAALLIPNKLGLQACVVEYVRVLLFGPMLPKIAMGVVYGLTTILMGGLYYLIFNDIGLARAFWKIWKNMRKPKHAKKEAIAVDYVRASIFGPIIPKIAIGLVYLLSIATLGGLFYIISHDVGIANTIRNIWAIKSEQKA
ncbi:putative succinate dehydrogenase, partial [Operophtera brumata]